MRPYWDGLLPGGWSSAFNHDTVVGQPCASMGSERVETHILDSVSGTCTDRAMKLTLE